MTDEQQAIYERGRTLGHYLMAMTIGMFAAAVLFVLFVLS